MTISRLLKSVKVVCIERNLFLKKHDKKTLPRMILIVMKLPNNKRTEQPEKKPCYIDFM